MAESRPISTIADEIERDWSAQKGGIHYTAKPYLDAMKSLNTINDSYGCDDAERIVLTFLSNATSWRGDKARAIKAELKALLKDANDH